MAVEAADRLLTTRRPRARVLPRDQIFQTFESWQSQVIDMSEDCKSGYEDWSAAFEACKPGYEHCVKSSKDLEDLTVQSSKVSKNAPPMSTRARETPPENAVSRSLRLVSARLADLRKERKRACRRIFSDAANLRPFLPFPPRPLILNQALALLEMSQNVQFCRPCAESAFARIMQG